jgi:hypothetical protein
MELHESFRLPAVLRAEPSATQHEDHRMLPLQIGQLPPFRGVVGEFVVGEDGARHDVGSHANPLDGMQRLQSSIDGWSPSVRESEPEVC